MSKDSGILPEFFGVKKVYSRAKYFKNINYKRSERDFQDQLFKYVCMTMYFETVEYFIYIFENIFRRLFIRKYFQKLMLV